MFNVTANANCKIYYHDLNASTGNNAAIVFLHGWGLVGGTFLPSLRILAQHRRVVSPDLPGFGQTKCDADDWDYQKLAQAIANLITNLGIEKVHLIGHSLGAAVCVKICTILPERVSSLILVDSAGIPFGSFRNLVFRRLLGLSEQFWVQLFLSPRYSLYYLKAFAYNFIYNPTSNFNAVDMPLYDDLRSTAQEIKQKTLIVWGEKDRTTPLEMGELLSQCFPNASLKVMRGNYYHEWSILYPGEFAKVVNEFIDGVERE